MNNMYCGPVVPLLVDSSNKTIILQVNGKRSGAKKIRDEFEGGALGKAACTW